jgi:4'-phosphopantetheinyl transferase EntD
MIERILPSSVAGAEIFADGSGPSLLPAGNTAVARATGCQDGEFTTAHAYALMMLKRQCVSPLSVLAGQREPQWPVGMTGSIARCVGYRAVAVALTSTVASLAVAAEPNKALRDHAMLDLTARDEERDRLRDLGDTEPGICWDRLLFSAKLAAYKVWFPLAPWWRNLHFGDVVIDAHYGTFTASLLVPGLAADGLPDILQGRWLSEHEILLAAVVVPV